MSIRESGSEFRLALIGFCVTAGPDKNEEGEWCEDDGLRFWPAWGPVVIVCRGLFASFNDLDVLRIAGAAMIVLKGKNLRACELK